MAKKLVKGTVCHKTILELLGIKLEHYNASGTGESRNDCVINSISYVTGSSWKEVYKDLYKISKKKLRVFNDIIVVSKYLKDRGYTERVFYDCDEELYEYETVLAFILEHKKGTYLIFISGHIFVLKDSTVIDGMNAGEISVEACLTEPIMRVWSKNSLDVEGEMNDGK